ncbi:MAG TPA: response regulator transcription factor [Planctomycetota bacterium]|nr:response regulator transcription factor [Planctomycetota bacterium]
MSRSKLNPITLLLVDDHQVVRVGLKALLQQTPSIRVTGEAATAAEAVREADRLSPDVVLMDIRLPDGSGIDACREIRKHSSGTRVLFLTSFLQDNLVLAAMAAGAQGYILKEIGTERLVQSIHDVANGKEVLDASATQSVLRQLLEVGKGGGKKGLLSPQEQRVGELLPEGKTNKEIGEILGLKEKTVKNYLSRVYEKLHVKTRAAAAAHFVRSLMES